MNRVAYLEPAPPFPSNEYRHQALATRECSWNQECIRSHLEVSEGRLATGLYFGFYFVGELVAPVLCPSPVP